MMPTLKLLGVSAMSWSPLARGLLCKPWAESVRKNTRRVGMDWFLATYMEAPGMEAIVNRVEEVTKKKDVSMAQIAIAWSLSKDEIAASVVGTTSLANLKDILEGVHVHLTKEEVQELYVPMKIGGHVWANNS